MNKLVMIVLAVFALNASMVLADDTATTTTENPAEKTETTKPTKKMKKAKKEHKEHGADHGKTEGEAAPATH